MSVPNPIRPATVEDLPQIHEIYTHYVLNTVVSFLVHAAPFDYVKSRFDTTQVRGLPYIVSTDANSPGAITGYAYASPFRGFMLGYGHSVEISIFVHPEHIGRGVGGALMEGLVERLKGAKHVSSEVGYEAEKREFEVKSVLAVMSVDEQSADKGMGLRDWYMKWGFEEVGRLKGIGFKDGRW